MVLYISTEYWHVDVFRPGLLPNMQSLVQIRHCMFKFKSFLVASRWRYDYNWISAFRCVQARTLIKCVKFGADKALLGWVTTTLQQRLLLWNVARGALSEKWKGGAIEPFCHIHFWNPYRMEILATSGVCAKFMVWCVFRPWKMQFISVNNNNNKRSTPKSVLAPWCLGPNK